MILGFSAEPITATVVDADTKEPLEGVIVVAHWQLVEGGFLDSSVPAGELMVMETTTDAKGKFHFPEWGPKYEFLGRMKNEDPELIVFKPGYIFKVLSNEWTSTEIRDYRSLRSSDWSGKIIELKAFGGTKKDYAEKVHNLDNKIDFARYGKNCEWIRIPLLLGAIENIGQHVEDQGIKLEGWRIGVRIRKANEVNELEKCSFKKN